MCHLSTEVLIEAGYDVGVVSDGVAAWDAIQFASYDLLVTENCLPEMSGLELLKNIHIAHIDLPVIMVIGASPAKMFHAPPWLQVEAMLVKPYTAAELLAVIKNVFYAINRAPDQIAWPQNQPEPPPTDGLRP
jgi:DNA-binding NtrC family response regulator